MSAIGKKQEDIEVFANHCVFVLSIYHHLRLIYETSSADDHARLHKAASIFFGDLHQMLVEYVVLQACKITDPAKDIRNNENHTVSFLLDHYGLRGDAALGPQLLALEKSILDFRKKILPARNKFISHADRDAILAGAPLGATGPGDWNQFWADLDQMVNLIHQKIIGTEMKLSDVAIISDADGLLKALQSAAHFESLLGDANPVVSQRAAALAHGA